MAKYIGERKDELKTIVKQLQDSNITIDDIKRHFGVDGEQ